MKADVDNGIGEFQLTARDGVSHLSFVAYSKNNLWYHYLTEKCVYVYQKRKCLMVKVM